MNTPTTICKRCLDVALAPDQRFCAGCGAELPREAAPTDAIRIATVLFADVAEFTQLSARLSLEQLKTLMDTVFERLYRVVLEHGGVVDKYIGDCVMALFGVPDAGVDDAARGVHAALAMQGALNELGPALEAEGLPAVRMRIGVDSGAVITGAVGAGPQRRYTVMGPPVNRAAHLQQEAPVGSVFVGDGCQRRVRGQFRLEPRQGGSGLAYLVRGERFGGRWLQPRELLGGGNELVGRSQQLARMRDALTEVIAEERAQMLLFIGGPGVGKSRLAFEFLATLEEEERSVWRLVGRGQDLGRGVPFAVVADALQRLLHLEHVDDASERDARLAGMLEAIGFAPAGRDLETLQTIFDPPRSPAGATVSIQIFAQRVMELVARLLDKIAEERPVVLVLDDLQLCDGATAQLLGYALRRLAGRPLLLIGLARPEVLDEHPQLVHAERVRRVDLDSLDQRTAAKLVRRTLGEDASTALTELVVERAKGNPQQIEELLRSFESSGVLQRSVTGWRVSEAPDLPAGDESVARLRVEALPAEPRAVLRRAAVIGRIFWRGALVALGCGEDVLDEALAELIRRELLVAREPSQLRGELEFSFSSEALVKAAYADGEDPERGDEADDERSPRLSRVRDHAAAAVWLCERPDPSAALWAEAGRQQLLARDPTLAVELFGRAGDTAFQATAYVDAVDHYGRAIALAEGGDRERLFELLARRERVLNALGRWREQREDAEALLALAEQSQRRDWTIEALLRLGRTSLNAGDHEAALATFERAHALCDEEREPEPTARALRWRALVHFNRSEHRQALPLFEQALHLAEARKLVELAAELAYEMGVTVGTVGDYTRAVQVSERALEMFRQQRNAYQEAFCLGNLGCFHCYLGDYARAVEALEQAVARGVELGAPLAEGFARANLGYARLAQGRKDEALELEVAAREAGEAIGDPRLVADACVYEALASLAGGEGRIDLPRARARARQALALAEEAGMPGSEAMALAALADAQRIGGDLTAARRASKQALTLLEGVGSIEGFETTIQVVHGRVCLACGDAAAAKAVLQRARRELLVKAEWIEDEGARRRFLEHVATNAQLLELAAGFDETNEIGA